METIGLSRISKSLDKAKNVGAVEESFTIEGCDITLENLNPDDYSAILHECQGLEDVEYLHTYQKQHIARSIVEINGVDLRGVKFIEDEEPDPNNPGQSRTFKVEKHTYFLKNIINTWKKEAVFTAYRKFVDTVEKAERKAKEGVMFLTPDETPEEKYRRLLLEMKEVEEDMPSGLVEYVLDEMGFMRKSRAEELKLAMEKADQLAREEAKSQTISEEKPEVSEPNLTVSETPETGDSAPEEPLDEPIRPKTADPHRSLQQAIALRQQAVAQPKEKPEEEEEEKKSRADRIAAMEAAAANSGLSITGKNGEQIPVYRMPGQEPVEVRKQEPVDHNAVSIDQPPKAGINPRFKPPQK